MSSKQGFGIKWRSFFVSLIISFFALILVTVLIVNFKSIKVLSQFENLYVEMQKNHDVVNIIVYDKDELITGVDVNERIKWYIANGEHNTIYSFYDQYTNDRLITKLIIAKGLEKDIPINRLFALSYIESSFNPYVVNKNRNGTHDYGLFQLNSRTFSSYSKEDILDIAFNVELATDFLKQQYDRYQNWEEAFIAYNAGNTNIVYNTSIQHFVKIVGYEDSLDKKFNYLF